MKNVPFYTIYQVDMIEFHFFLFCFVFSFLSSSFYCTFEPRLITGLTTVLSFLKKPSIFSIVLI